MDVKASVKYLRISPRKARLAAGVLRGLNVSNAEIQLQMIVKRSVSPLKKLLNSAVANAKNNFNLEKDNLFVSEIKVNEGPTLKRWMPRAMGRATQILKRTSHIELVLSEIKPTQDILPNGGQARYKIQDTKKSQEPNLKPQEESKKSIEEKKAEIKDEDRKDKIDHRKTFEKDQRKIKGGQQTDVRKKFQRRKVV